ncbi:SIR2 family protein [Mucilaginibacter rigui]|uniref:SIR2 family protein n=1 Tax=Mucilaginibacter rigui TaxID=534635 RepID=A0ABR7X1Z3_9SPHI|nr:SIR2 family protein [Mucilaginibacter rigui]MBD1384610.1 SIR2 family protein [Mucilaginibacter rigui]
MANNAYQDEPPVQFFFQHLLNVLLTTISQRITQYAYHAEGHSDIDENSEMGMLFVKWMKQKKERGNLRLYTLNYERIFKVLLERTGTPVFEGFDCGEYIAYTDRLRANVPKILADDISDVHYNLHGSAFWEVLDLDHAQLPNPEIVLTAFPHLPINNSPASFQVEKGKTIMVTNLITGYQKAQKAMITPFKQMQAAFDKDCCFADNIYIIGYSLGDEHINESIKTALRHNSAIKITIVDPFFIKNKKDFDIAIKYYPFKQTTNFSPTNIDGNRIYSYLEGALMVYNVTFQDFLKMQTDISFRFRFNLLND